MRRKRSGGKNRYRERSIGKMLVLILCLAPHRFSDFYASLFKGLKGDHLFYKSVRRIYCGVRTRETDRLSPNLRISVGFESKPCFF